MPYINRKTLMNHAIAQGYEKAPKSESVTQKKETPQSSKRPLPLPKRVGRITLPPKQLLKQIDVCVENEKRYIEYRTGLFKGVIEGISKATLNCEDKQKTFMSLVSNSNDIKSLVIDTSLVKTLDRIDGLPKLLFTLFSKWAEANFYDS